MLSSKVRILGPTICPERNPPILGGAASPLLVIRELSRVRKQGEGSVHPRFLLVQHLTQLYLPVSGLVQSFSGQPLQRESLSLPWIIEAGPWNTALVLLLGNLGRGERYAMYFNELMEVLKSHNTKGKTRLRHMHLPSFPPSLTQQAFT